MRLNLLIISLILILQSCSLTKHVPTGQSLLVENNIVIQANEDQKSLITKSEINDVIKQKPNGNIFGFIPFHLSIYNLSDTLKKNWLHKYLRKIGEEPVIVNTDLTKKSTVQIERLLAQKGYFNSIIQNSIETENKKSKINYNIFLGNTYSIQKINYPLFKDEKINKKINNGESSLIKKGDMLNAGKLNEERNRINEILQNHGFFNSKRENIYFNVDTSFQNKSTEISIQLDTLDDNVNKQYTINKIIVLIDSPEKKMDTIILREMNFINSQDKIKARILESHINGTLISINQKECWLQLIGDFNVSNACAVYGAAIQLGMAPDIALQGMSALEPIDGRFQKIEGPNNIMGIVDYAHTPDALEKTLNNLQKFRKPSQRIITIIGCGGDRDKDKRPKMASVSASLCDYLILTSDNPRTEKPRSILKEMENGLKELEKKHCITIEDRREAIKLACQNANPGDIIVLAGKGHEKFQEINGEKTPFDDALILKNMLMDVRA